MTRVYNARNIHTNPSKAGAKNLKGIKMQEDSQNTLEKIIPIKENGKRYKGRWTDEEFSKSIADYFDYCASNSVKPTPSTLCLWLGTNKVTINEWKNKPEKYSDKSYQIQTAYLLMEAYLEANVDSYPTGSIFLLKCSHGFQDTTRVEVNTTNQVNQNEIDNVLDKLGLDK